MIMPERKEYQETKAGNIQWHASEEGGGPDVGILIGLGGGKALWLGEMLSKETPNPMGFAIYDNGTKHIFNLEYYELVDLLQDHIAPALAASNGPSSTRNLAPMDDTDWHVLAQDISGYWINPEERAIAYRAASEAIRLVPQYLD